MSTQLTRKLLDLE